MRFLRSSVVCLAAATVVSSGCGLGYDRLLFVTKTNVGIDVDTKPPTAEISIARREGVIEPTFEGGQTIPVAASFGIKNGFFDPDITGTFAGSTAAVYLGAKFDSDDSKPPPDANGALCLTKRPTPSGFWNGVRSFFGMKPSEPEDVVPFFFATDSSFGLKVAWSGATEAIPDTVKLGYNRKEFAYAPIMVQGGGADVSTAGAGACPANKFIVAAPSFLATTDNASRVGSLGASGVTRSQFFATGKAAEQFALRPNVRTALGEKLLPEAAPVLMAARRTSIDAIVASFKKSDDAKKNEIISKAIDLKLVASGTDATNFESRLAANEAKDVQDALKELEKVASK